jgi:peptide/nickel transport system permease protein
MTNVEGNQLNRSNNESSQNDLLNDSSSNWQSFFQRFMKKKLGVISLVLIIVMYMAGIFAPVLAPYSYTEQNLERSLEGPSSDHILGTDTLGRDMYSRVLYSIRTTLIVTFAVVVSGSLVLGTFLGLLSGYKGGITDTIIMRIGDVFASLPGLPLLILVNAALSPKINELSLWIDENTFINDFQASGAASYITIFFALSLFSWVGSARLIRSQVLSIREKDYITAARSIGLKQKRIVIRHLLPNISNLLILLISSSLGAIAGSEIVLTWFGVGVQPPAASFGQMLYAGSGARTFQAYPHLLLVPAFFVTILMFAFNILGDALNDVLRRD